MLLSNTCDCVSSENYFRAYESALRKRNGNIKKRALEEKEQRKANKFVLALKLRTCDVLEKVVQLLFERPKGPCNFISSIGTASSCRHYATSTRSRRNFEY
jgi:hypothetical protein